MYAWLWRMLPGPVWLRAIICLLLAMAVVAICFRWVFPVLAPYMPFNSGTVECVPRPYLKGP
jgi:hypothetical protein